MLNFDTTVRPKRPSQWAAVLDGVYNAAEPDEQKWLEWKSAIDLTSKEDVADKIAKHVIAMANRDPAESLLHVGGLGIIVLGMEPGSAEGVTPVDNADLDKLVCTYVGADGPVWQPHWDQYLGKTILIIEVEPPQPGDPIHCFRKQIGKIADGAIYVRGKARSDPADSSAIRRLTNRATTQVASTLDIAVSIENADDLRPCLDNAESLQNYLAAERKRLAVEDGGPWFSNEAEEQEYSNDVANYLASVEAAWPNLLHEAASFVLAPAVFIVSNQAGKNLVGLQVEVELSGADGVLKAQDTPADFDILKVLPPKMQSLGTRRLGRIGAGFGNNVLISPYQSSLVDYGPETSITEVDDGVYLEFPDRDVRIGRVEVLDDELVIALVGVAGTVTGRWTATAENVDAEASGQFEVVLSQPPVDVLAKALEEATSS
ncbi:helix-turn-helix domain-containing protein (plasmid) [Rhodococcoides fascians]|uniref:AlbA family DNA-binding domain-containing protein n=1 Tax=Rhodococcoides fascians TaxID=1828 RepID=UPI00389A2DA1